MKITAFLHETEPTTPSENITRTVQRQCRIHGCETLHRRDLFCCAAHWAALPKHLRDAIWAAYRSPGVFSNQYLQAAENAEAFLEDRDAVDVGKVFE